MGSPAPGSIGGGSDSIADTVICPLCEHAQERGAECDACGARLAAPEPQPEAPTGTLSGLETNAIDGAPGPAIASAEPDGGAWLERTAAAAVAVTVEALDVERAARDRPDRDRTPAAAPACRYCRTPAAPGQQFCEGCGMRLRSYRAPAADPDPGSVRCRGCGTVMEGPRCPGCGARAPAPS